MIGYNANDTTSVALLNDLYAAYGNDATPGDVDVLVGVLIEPILPGAVSIVLQVCHSHSLL